MGVPWHKPKFYCFTFIFLGYKNFRRFCMIKPDTHTYLIPGSLNTLPSPETNVLHLVNPSLCQFLIVKSSQCHIQIKTPFPIGNRSLWSISPTITGLFPTVIMSYVCLRDQLIGCTPWLLPSVHIYLHRSSALTPTCGARSDLYTTTMQSWHTIISARETAWAGYHIYNLPGLLKVIKYYSLPCLCLCW